MEYQINHGEKELGVTLKGKFSFADHQNFKEILEAVETTEADRVMVNIEEVESVDSAALGILLLLKDLAVKHKLQLVLKHPRGHVKKMFELSKFYKHFEIYD